MKPLTTFLLVASLTANAALVWLVLSHPKSAAPSAGAESIAAANARPKKSADTAVEIDANTWVDLDSKDLARHLARLRASGFPIEMIRAILSAQISESFAARRKALDPEAETRPFWKNRPPDPKIEIALRQTYREQQKMLRELMGKDAEEDDPMAGLYDSRRMQGVPTDKVDMVKEIMREFDDKRQDVYSGGLYNIERDKLTALDKAQHDAIAKVLSPQELLEYDLRNSQTASSLRYSMAAFDVTEQEFRTLYEIQRPFDEQFNIQQTGPMSQEQMRQRSEAQKQLNEQIKAALGPDRYAQYEKATDYSYRQTSQLVTRLELPPTTTDEVYAVQKDIQQRIRPLYGNRDLTPADRTAQLAALNEEAKTRITSILTPRGYEAYRQYGGNWLQQLQPRPAPGQTGTITVRPGP